MSQVILSASFECYGSTAIINIFSLSYAWLLYVSDLG